MVEIWIRKRCIINQEFARLRTRPPSNTAASTESTRISACPQSRPIPNLIDFPNGIVGDSEASRQSETPDIGNPGQLLSVKDPWG